MGSDSDSPFAHIPEPVDGPYEGVNPYTIEGEIDQYGQLARGVSRRPILRWVIGAFLLVVVALIIYVPFSN